MSSKTKSAAPPSGPDEAEKKVLRAFGMRPQTSFSVIASVQGVSVDFVESTIWRWAQDDPKVAKAAADGADVIQAAPRPAVEPKLPSPAVNPELEPVRVAAAPDGNGGRVVTEEYVYPPAPPTLSADQLKTGRRKARPRTTLPTSARPTPSTPPVVEDPEPVEETPITIELEPPTTADTDTPAPEEYNAQELLDWARTSGKVAITNLTRKITLLLAELATWYHDVAAEEEQQAQVEVEQLRKERAEALNAKLDYIHGVTHDESVRRWAESQGRSVPKGPVPAAVKRDYLLAIAV